MFFQMHLEFWLGQEMLVAQVAMVIEVILDDEFIKDKVKIPMQYKLRIIPTTADVTVFISAFKIHFGKKNIEEKFHLKKNNDSW